MWLFAFCYFPFQVGEPTDLDGLLRRRIEFSYEVNQVPAPEPMASSDRVVKFYEANGYKAVWVDPSQKQRLKQLLSALSELEKDGLPTNLYHVEYLVKQTAPDAFPTSVATQVDLEVLGTDAFLTAANDLLNGRLSPKTLDPEWYAIRPERDPIKDLMKALESGDVGASLISMRPNHEGYLRLINRASQLSSLASSEPDKVDSGPLIKPGQSEARIAKIRARLNAFYKGKKSELPISDDYDQDLQDMIVIFQDQHGLEPDGVIGPETLGHLNWSFDDRARTITANLERWRWLPEDLGSRYILVNIASFQLEVREKDHVVFQKRVVVGRDARRTPVFTGKMSYLVLSPYWNIPPKLAVEDKLPLIRKNTSYLSEQGIRMYRGWGADAVEVDPFSIDWKQVSGRQFNYRLRQDPGPKNALGDVKFMFPNEYNIYLHDTPARELFKKSFRAFSSGCIRLEDPMSLAHYLLSDQPQWTDARIKSVIDSRKETMVSLTSSIPVHLLYWTVWVDDQGLIQWRNDIYGRDRPLIAALLPTDE